MDDFPSPYSATILLSSPQQGKLTVKADLIFEDFLGMDLHQKVILMKESSSNVVHKHGMKHVSSFAHPKDLYAIKDDNKSTPTAPAEQKKASRPDTDFIPSFNLLDEELEESKMPSFKLVDEDTDEGSPAMLVEDADCKIINEQTVFDHIRKKAKNLPILATSNVDPQFSPSLETLTLIRKSNRERQLELDSAIEVLDDMDEESNSHLNLVSLAEPKKAEQSRQFDKDLIPNCHINTACAANSADMLDLAPEESTSRTLAGERIFEHIRKKATNFPVLETPFEIPSPDSFLVKKELQSPGNPIGSNMKQFHSTVLPKRQRCFSQTMGEIREAESCLGFKSVFSFL